MHYLLRIGFAGLALVASAPARAQAPAERTLVVSPAVGEVIDAAEKARFGLFPNYAADNFLDARFVRALAPDSALTLRIRQRDGQVLNRPSLPVEFDAVRAVIDGRLRELVQAGPVAAPVAPSAALAPGYVVASSQPELIGSSYSVELKSGNSFIGVLRTAGPQELEFETKDLGTVRVQRTNLRDLVLLTAQQTRKGYDYVGNGNRLFFGPTARNLRRGEGYVQDIDIFLLNANYGITNNFSMGIIASFIPAAGSYNLIGFTPKVSFGSKNDNLHFGTGAMLIFVGGYAAGVTYANATVGSADNNLTGGVGFGFSGGGGFGSTPVLMLGGATRVSRRISLMNETYVVHYSDSYSKRTALAGIAGLRVAWPRISGGLGLMYAHNSYDEQYSFGRVSQNYTDAYPYGEVTFRFGRVK
ncbi:hypothetical protein [Hymenobacter properus]|uniref:Uncharacterized protein n=1 Tax=Hymenobacter properus TaxID=2791026 RepID=A0A931FM36_9BACT|nr:hypothetical protein [Hymenobacter properus]MBF9141299.1 hypothetical protein [Hymenobacter properus]MBR7720109.1 hypothetical protein [Microvirga sp. SRT04]